MKFFEKIATEKLIWGLIAIGIILYLPGLFNGFVGDDIGYINHPYIKTFDVLKFFQSSSSDLGGTSPLTGQFYRPFMLVAISAIYRIFGEFAFFFHLSQILIHIVNAILVFALYSKFFKRTPAFIASLIFLVHPVNVETVAYVSDLQDVLFVLFGLTAMNMIVYFNKARNFSISIPILLLCSLLSKETGILFVLIAILYSYLFLKFKIKDYLSCFALPVIVYGFVRLVIGGLGVGKITHTVFGEMSILARLEQMPFMLFYYLKTFLLPIDLAIAQTWVIKTNILPQVLVTLVFLCLIIVFFILHKLYKRKNKVTLFFSVWLILGLVFHLQIIPLEMTVADRWFYFPIIGLLGVLALIFEKYRLKQNIIFATFLIILPISFFRSFVRQLDWKDPITLYSHDVKVTNSYLLNHSYGFELMQKNENEIAFKFLDKSVDSFPTSANLNTLGVWYFRKNNLKQAKYYFEKSIRIGDSYLSYNNLSRILIGEGNFSRASEVLKKATRIFPKSDAFWYLLAISLSKQGKNDDAKVAAQRAYDLSKSNENKYVLDQLINGRDIKIFE